MMLVWLNTRLVEFCTYVLKLLILFKYSVLGQCKELLNIEGHFEFSKIKVNNAVT